MSKKDHSISLLSGIGLGLSTASVALDDNLVVSVFLAASSGGTLLFMSSDCHRVKPHTTVIGAGVGFFGGLALLFDASARHLNANHINSDMHNVTVEAGVVTKEDLTAVGQKAVYDFAENKIILSETTRTQKDFCAAQKAAEKQNIETGIDINKICGSQKLRL